MVVDCPVGVGVVGTPYPIQRRRPPCTPGGNPGAGDDVTPGREARRATGPGTRGTAMRKATTAAALVVTLLLTACTGGDEADRGARSLVGQGGGLAAAAALIAFDACDDLLGYVREVGGEQVGPYGLEAPGMVVTDAMEMRAADTAAGADGAAPAPMAAEQAAGDAAGLAADAGFSTTNVQEEGVDEPDTAKTDGRLLVAVAQVAPGPDAQDPYARVPALQVLDVSGDEPRLM